MPAGRSHTELFLIIIRTRCSLSMLPREGRVRVMNIPRWSSFLLFGSGSRRTPRPITARKGAGTRASPRRIWTAPGTPAGRRHTRPSCTFLRPGGPTAVISRRREARAMIWPLWCLSSPTKPWTGWTPRIIASCRGASMMIRSGRS